jgi:molybdate transport system substrate-binding protein
VLLTGLRGLPSRCLLLCLLLLCAPALRADTKLWAAASLADVLDAAIADWHASGGGPVQANYAATSLLARQIAQGAQADVFMSADADWMDWLAERGHLQGPSLPWAANRLVLIAASDAPTIFTALTDLPNVLGTTARLAIADPDHVPAGRYARAALEHLGLWDALGPRLTPFENVRATLRAVAGGSLPLGIVYATDARIEAAVRTVAVFPAASHPPIVYRAARLRGDANPAADEFFRWLHDTGIRRPLLEAHGFTEPPPS